MYGAHGLRLEDRIGDYSVESASSTTFRERAKTNYLNAVASSNWRTSRAELRAERSGDAAGRSGRVGRLVACVWRRSIRAAGTQRSTRRRCMLVVNLLPDSNPSTKVDCGC